MTLKGECHSGYSLCDRPTTVDLDGDRFEVEEILREWREPDAKHFIIRVKNGRQFSLVLYETSGVWDAREVSDSH